MADVNLELAVAMQTQPGSVIPQAFIDDTSLDSDDGLIYGDAESGTGSSGVTFSTTARTRETAGLPGSRTPTDPHFVAEDIESFQIATAMAGNRAARSGSPSSGDFTPAEGLNQMLKAGGLTPVPSASNTIYVPGTPETSCAIVYDSGQRTGVQDALANTLTIQYDAGAVPIITADMVGAVAPFGANSAAGEVSRSFAFPTVNYGTQLSVPPPLTALTGAVWNNGGGAQDLCFQTLTVTLDNGVTLVQDACKSDGFRRAPAAKRATTLAGTVFSNSLDVDALWDAMVNAAVSTSTYSFGVGVATAGSGDIIERHQWVFNGLRVSPHEVVEIDETGLRGITFTAAASANIANGEYVLTFN